ncbi:hypothetical protein BWI96_10525 [Siphonobacter sp. SORGH_AS_0500]|uniref:hypothetical protein n=1 Tax=Siphonobacter sp. SORGH_AS_0500 TaxID=1864824 RepID=UPI000CB00146|nr:hypothetical protein [Siphonobacter sp. SORGH_AS_0500]PKK36797.1 hypothetical protein BWI96_10525 [Siphonobacter sp. SORGH_AS_0500]
MDHGFKTRFDQMRENNPASLEAKQPGQIVPNHEVFHPIGYARNLCLVWPEGRRYFFNYAYLIAAEFLPGPDLNLIRLEFSSHQVVLKGYELEALFLQLLDHLPRIITAIDARYIIDRTQGESLIVNMEVEKPKN